MKEKEPPFSLHRYFSKVFVIHMEKDVARKHHILEEFKKIHTEVEFSPGVIPTPRDRETYASPLCKQICSQSMIGIYLAHRRIWERMVEEHIPHAVIFEDDVAFTENIFTTFPKAFQELPPYWELLHLGCLTCGEKDVLHLAGALLVHKNPFAPNPIYSKHLRIPSVVLGAEAYALTLEGAQKLLQYLPYAENHVDVMISSILEKLQHYAVSPPVAYQHPSGFQISNNQAKAPVYINQILSSVRISHKPTNHIHIAYTLSIPLAQLNDTTILNLWCVVFFLLGYLSVFLCVALFIYLLGEYLFMVWKKGKKGMEGQYAVYIYLLCIGQLLHEFQSV